MDHIIDAKYYNMNLCRRINKEINDNGIDYTTAKFKNIDHEFDKYQSPGE